MHYYRRPKTTQERRYASGVEVDHYDDCDVPPIRGRRKARSIPNAWDDIWARPQRSWKKHRKTQWKPKKLSEKKKHSKFRGHLNPRGHRMYKKPIWGWGLKPIGRQWNPDATWWKYVWHSKRDGWVTERQIGKWEDVYGWRWVKKHVYVTYYEDVPNSKVIRTPIIKTDPYGVQYFDGGWEDIKKEAMVKASF